MTTAVMDNYPQTREFLDGHSTTRLESHQNTSEELHRLRQENEMLTEIFQFGVWEFENKNRRIALLEEEIKERESIIKELQKENEKLRRRIKELKAKINLLNKMLFGRKSEKKKTEEAPIVKVTKRRGAVKEHIGHGRKIPENLPVVEEFYELPEEERYCQICGLALDELPTTEDSYEVGVKKTYFLIRKRRRKYKKTCRCPNPIVTAPPPPAKLIPRGKFSIEFWVDVLINKFKNHLPIERQVSDMKEYGLPVPVGTIFGGLKKIHSSYLEPLYEAMAKCLGEANHFHADESGWKLFALIDEKKNYKWFIWVFVSKDIVLFVLYPTRSAEVPLKTIFDIGPNDIKRFKADHKEKKRMTVDKFSSYKRLERLGLVELSFCWAHQRRKFLDSRTKYPELSNWVEEWIRRIGKLYHINNERIKYSPEDPLFKEYDEKLRDRIDEVYSLITLEYNHQEQASIMNSMKEHWKGLTLFVDNPEIPMDNNMAERMLRSMVLGRKNYWGNHSLWAGQLTVEMLSIVQTCIIHGISPRAYLTYYLTECAKRGSAPKEDEIEAFLPHKLSQDMRERLRVNKPEGPAPG